MDEIERDLGIHERRAERAHDRAHELFIRTNESTISVGNFAARTVLLINGAAAIALLSFIGSLVGDDTSVYRNHLAGLTAPLMWFVWGVAASAIGMGLAFFRNSSATKYLYDREMHYEPPYVRNPKKKTQFTNIRLF